MTMDVLSDILRTFRIGGALYFRTEYSAPWGIELPEDGNVARFHYVKHGECFVVLPDREEPLHLREGELAIVPHGARHTLLNPADSDIVPLDSVLESTGFDGSGSLRYGGGGKPSQLVCGYFCVDDDELLPVARQLPTVVHIGAQDGPTAWVDGVIAVIDREAQARAAGADAVIGRLCEILFVQSLRVHLGQANTSEGVLAGLADASLARALMAMHRAPAESFTVESLARAAGMSRSVFADRFRELVGCTPLQYLTRWRIQVAKHAMSTWTESMAELGAAVGYRSEAAFSRAFKRLVGTGPAEYRARQRSSGG